MGLLPCLIVVGGAIGQNTHLACSYRAWEYGDGVAESIYLFYWLLSRQPLTLTEVCLPAPCLATRLFGLGGRGKYSRVCHSIPRYLLSTAHACPRRPFNLWLKQVNCRGAASRTRMRS